MSRLKNLGPVMQFERQKTKRSQRQMKTKRATKKYSNFRRQVPKHKERGTFSRPDILPPGSKAQREIERAEHITYLPIGTAPALTLPVLRYPRLFFRVFFRTHTKTHTHTHTRTHTQHTQHTQHTHSFLTNICDVKLISDR